MPSTAVPVGIGGRTSGHILHSIGLRLCQIFFGSQRIYMLHTAVRKMETFQRDSSGNKARMSVKAFPIPRMDFIMPLFTANLIYFPNVLLYLYTVMKWKKTLKVLFATLALVLLYFFLSGGIHWSDFINGLRSVDYFWIVMSILVGAFSLYVRAARWRIILLGLGKPVKRIDTFNGVGMAYLTNFALPRAGEVARCGVVAQRTGLGFDKVLGTVVMERTFDVLCRFDHHCCSGFPPHGCVRTFYGHRITGPFCERLGGSADSCCFGDKYSAAVDCHRLHIPQTTREADDHKKDLRILCRDLERVGPKL